MGREIKFRAWDEGENCYVEEEGLKYCEASFDDNGKLHVGVWTEENRTGDFIEFEVEQFTGLRDMKCTEEFPKGQMIYEGDILKPVYSDTLKIATWDDDRACFIGQNVFNEPLHYNLNIHEIIGNIRKNKDLLNE